MKGRGILYIKYLQILIEDFKSEQVLSFLNRILAGHC